MAEWRSGLSHLVTPARIGVWFAHDAKHIFERQLTALGELCDDLCRQCGLFSRSACAGAPSSACHLFKLLESELLPVFEWQDGLSCAQNAHRSCDQVG